MNRLLLVSMLLLVVGGFGGNPPIKWTPKLAPICGAKHLTSTAIPCVCRLSARILPSHLRGSLPLFSGIIAMFAQCDDKTLIPAK